jgi:ABC-type anion transport system duplicated permease subunit
VGRSGRSVSLGFVVWVVIGVIVASNHQYLVNLKTLGAVLSALLAVLLWPLILLGTKITINI